MADYEFNIEDHAGGDDQSLTYPTLVGGSSHGVPVPEVNWGRVVMPRQQFTDSWNLEMDVYVPHRIGLSVSSPALVVWAHEHWDADRVAREIWRDILAKVGAR